MPKILFNCLVIAFLTSLLACNKIGNSPYTGYVCPANRFTTQTFSYNTYTVAYSQAPDYTGKTQSLALDMYIPAADTLPIRPLIIYCHGGNFTSGARNSAWPVKFCKAFVARGYVTASIDYRMGIGTVNDEDVISAQIRAVQDLKAAVRFFKKTAAEQGNPYRIDTAQIFVAGESSGAVIALQTAYLKTPAQFSEVADVDLLTSLNGIEGNTTAAPYSSNIAGVIGLDGATLDLNWVAYGSLSTILVHSTTDAATPYKQGIVSPYTATPLYGSYLIDSAAVSNHIGVSLLTFNGAGNQPFVTKTKYADSTVNFVSTALFSLINCERLGKR